MRLVVDQGGDREFFSLKQIADTARRENWPTGRVLEEGRKMMKRKRRAKQRHAK